MAWWHRKVVFPVKRAWLAVSVRIKPRKDDGGVLRRLHDEVQMCGYQDVQVMWEMLRRSSEMDLLAKQQQQQCKRPFWRFSSSWSSSSTATTSRATSSSPCNYHHY